MTMINDRVSAYVNSNPTKSAFAWHLLDHGYLAGEEKILQYEDNFKRRDWKTRESPREPNHL